jgi:hypothetical protein
MCIIRIGNDAEFLTLMLRGRSHAGSTDYWDGNWLACTAEIAVGAFRGCLDQSIRTDELEGFRQQLEQLYQHLTGEAVLQSMEHWLSIQMVGHRRGHFDIYCRLCDDPAFGNTLDCRFHFDQTDLSPLLRQLHSALDVYPVIGR